MKTVKVFGYSDDNIEIRGDLGSDEFGAYRPKYLHFNDGTVIRGAYSEVADKGWVIEVVKLGKGAEANYLMAEYEDDDHFSDVLEVKGNFTSVKAWDAEDGPSTTELVEFFAELDFGDYPLAKLLAAYNALEG